LNMDESQTHIVNFSYNHIVGTPGNINCQDGFVCHLLDSDEDASRVHNRYRNSVGCRKCSYTSAT
jgi:hypothetical protein